MGTSGILFGTSSAFSTSHASVSGALPTTHYLSPSIRLLPSQPSIPSSHSSPVALSLAFSISHRHPSTIDYPHCRATTSVVAQRKPPSLRAPFSHKTNIAPLRLYLIAQPCLLVARWLRTGTPVYIIYTTQIPSSYFEALYETPKIAVCWQEFGATDDAGWLSFWRFFCGWC